MRRHCCLLLIAVAWSLLVTAGALAQSTERPNIILILSDDFGFGDAGPYGGGQERAMPTPNLDRLANEGMTFFDFYAQASCTPGRAAVQTGRIPNRSGMTVVAFPGQGGGLPKAEWTLASVLKQAGYKTFFTGKWHLGESDYAMPTEQGYDEMRYAFLYHLNAYTYADEAWFPDMDPQQRAMFKQNTKGSLSGMAGGKIAEDFKVNGEYVNTPEKGVVGIPFLDAYVQKATLDYLDKAAKTGKPFFMSVNFMKAHQPNLPHPDFIHKSPSKTKYADSIVENDARIGKSSIKYARLAWTRTPTFFGRRTTAPGRTSIPTQATRRFGGPRARCAKAATACPSLPGAPRSSPARKITTSLAAWISWPRSPRLPG